MFLPSEVARLILGYLLEMGCKQTSEAFLCESKNLEEFVQVLEEDNDYPLTIDGKSLINILTEYSRLKHKERQCGQGSSLKKSRMVSSSIKDLMDISKIRRTRHSLNITASYNSSDNLSGLNQSGLDKSRMNPSTTNEVTNNDACALPINSTEMFISRYIQVPTPLPIPTEIDDGVFNAPATPNVPMPAQPSYGNQVTTQRQVDTSQNHSCVVTQTHFSPRSSSNVQMPQENTRARTSPVHRNDSYVSVCKSTVLTSTPIEENSSMALAQNSSSTVLDAHHVTTFTQAFLELGASKGQKSSNGPMSCPPVFPTLNSPANSPMQVYSSPAQKSPALCTAPRPSEMGTPESGPPPNISLRHPYYFESPNTLQTMCNRLPNYSMTTPSKSHLRNDSPRRKSVTPRRRLLPMISQDKVVGTSSPSNTIVGNITTEVPDVHNEDSYGDFNALFEQMLHAQPLHEKIAENINKIARLDSIPEVESEICKQAVAETHQEVNLSDHAIREIVSQTQMDPVFESLLSMFEDKTDTPMKNSCSLFSDNSFEASLNKNMLSNAELQNINPSQSLDTQNKIVEDFPSLPQYDFPQETHHEESIANTSESSARTKSSVQYTPDQIAQNLASDVGPSSKPPVSSSAKAFISLSEIQNHPGVVKESSISSNKVVSEKDKQVIQMEDFLKERNKKISVKTRKQSMQPRNMNRHKEPWNFVKIAPNLKLMPMQSFTNNKKSPEMNKLLGSVNEEHNLLQFSKRGPHVRTLFSKTPNSQCANNVEEPSNAAIQISTSVISSNNNLILLNPSANLIFTNPEMNPPITNRVENLSQLSKVPEDSNQTSSTINERDAQILGLTSSGENISTASQKHENSTAKTKVSSPRKRKANTSGEKKRKSRRIVEQSKDPDDETKKVKAKSGRGAKNSKKSPNKLQSHDKSIVQEVKKSKKTSGKVQSHDKSIVQEVEKSKKTSGKLQSHGKSIVQEVEKSKKTSGKVQSQDKSIVQEVEKSKKTSGKLQSHDKSIVQEVEKSKKTPKNSKSKRKSHVKESVNSTALPPQEKSCRPLVTSPSTVSVQPSSQRDQLVDLSIKPSPTGGLVYTYFKDSNIMTTYSFKDGDEQRFLANSEGATDLSLKSKTDASAKAVDEMSLKLPPNKRKVYEIEQQKIKNVDKGSCATPKNDEVTQAVILSAGATLNEESGAQQSGLSNKKELVAEKEAYSKKLKKLTDLDAFLNKVHGE